MKLITLLMHYDHCNYVTNYDNYVSFQGPRVGLEEQGRREGGVMMDSTGGQERREAQAPGEERVCE